jgi:uncharacterized OB-fold protein
MDGADNIFSHIINETDVRNLKVGMKVRAWAKDKKRLLQLRLVVDRAGDEEICGRDNQQ